MHRRNGRPASVPSASSLLDPPESTPQEQHTDPLGHFYAPNPFPDTFRHSGWHEHRLRVYRSLQRTEQSTSRLWAFRDCGTRPWIFRSKDDPTVYRVGTDQCRDRFCVPCGTDRARRIVSNMTTYLHGRTVRFITLTLAGNDNPLLVRLRHLAHSFARLRRRALWKRAVSGGVAFLEVKRSKDANGWHPHLHCIVTGTWIDARKLRKLWLDITGDSYIVDVQLVRSHLKLARYVVKYVSKPMNTSFANDPEHLDEAVLALKGRKMVTAFGTFADLHTTAQPDDTHWEPVLSLDDLNRRAANGEAWALDLVEQFKVQVTAATSLPPPCETPDVRPCEYAHGQDLYAQSRFDFPGH